MSEEIREGVNVGRERRTPLRANKTGACEDESPEST